MSCTTIIRLYALVAQLDRVSDYGSEGCGFDFCRARHNIDRRSTVDFYYQLISGRHIMGRLLIVVDMQNDFVDGALGFEGADGIIEGIASKIRSYKDNNDEVVYTLDTHFDNYPDTQEGRNLPVPHCIKGSSGHELVPGLKDLLADCLCFEKPTFGSLKLANYINSNEDKYDVIEVCGLVSNICVISNAIITKAAAPEAQIIVDSTLTDSFDKTLNSETFDILKGVQVTVL